MHLRLLILLFLTGHQSAEGSGFGEDHDSSGQESEWGPKEETICGHCDTWGSKGTQSCAFFQLAFTFPFFPFVFWAQTNSPLKY